MRRRVVVTGMGVITPIGNSVEEFWNAVREEKTGFGEITHFDASGYKCHLAAEVKNFDGKNYMDPKAAKRMELFCQYAVAATKEAIADAGLEMEKEDPYLVGTAIGSGVGSLQHLPSTVICAVIRYNQLNSAHSSPPFSSKSESAHAKADTAHKVCHKNAIRCIIARLIPKRFHLCSSLSSMIAACFHRQRQIICTAEG